MKRRRSCVRQSDFSNFGDARSRNAIRGRREMRQPVVVRGDPFAKRFRESRHQRRSAFHSPLLAEHRTNRELEFVKRAGDPNSLGALDIRLKAVCREMGVDRERVGRGVEQMGESRGDDVARGRERFAQLNANRRFSRRKTRANDAGSVTDTNGAGVNAAAFDFDSTRRSRADETEESVPSDRRAVRDRESRLENPHVDVLLRIRFDVGE